eukprot:157925-Amphidinium_carterae.5
MLPILIDMWPSVRSSVSCFPRSLGFIQPLPGKPAHSRSGGLSLACNLLLLERRIAPALKAFARLQENLLRGTILLQSSWNQRQLTITIPWSFIVSLIATIFICLHYSYLGSTRSPLATARQFDIWTMAGGPSLAADNGDFAVINGHTEHNVALT